MRKILHWFLALMFIGAVTVPQTSRAAGGQSFVYLPLVSKNFNPLAGQRIVNAPFLNVSDITGQKFNEMAIFWFGRVNQNDNYVDVRVAYSGNKLTLYHAVFDRQLWFDTTPSAAEFTQWDTISVFLDVDGGTSSLPGPNSYRFDVQYSGSNSLSYQVAYRGNGSGWTPLTLSFDTFTSDRWDTENGGPPNSGSNARGWQATINIPFASLGLTQPTSNSVWRFAVVNYDRNALSDSLVLMKTWPEAADVNSPQTWGRLRFGLPSYTSLVPLQGTSTIRHKLNGATVVDANVGGYTVCGNGSNFWNTWGDTLWSFYNPELSDFNIQNQADIADWPCFAKYYITFPLTSLPTNKVIRSAKLTLYQTGNAEPSQAKTSYIQVLTVGTHWTQSSLTWNNAPLALENVSVAPVAALPGFAGFPGVAREWNLNYAVAQAYTQGQSFLRLVLYSADSDYHSGKYFVASGTGDWNATGRPTLTVEYGNP